jgi:hypothetical protein
LENLISKSDLLARGWTERELGLVFDEPDGSGPSRHWRNPIGEPLYDKDRVKMAAWRTCRRGARRPTQAEADHWLRSSQPTSEPLFIADLHRLAEAYIPNARYQFFSLRLSHPICGRQPGTEDREFDYIKMVLAKLVGVAAGEEPKDWASTEAWFAARAQGAAAGFGWPWPKVCARKVRRTTFISRATGKKHLEKALDSWALVQAGAVESIPALGRVLPGALVTAPILRFDLQTLRPTPPIRTDRERMDEFFATVRYVRLPGQPPIGDWREMPETEPEDD